MTTFRVNLLASMPRGFRCRNQFTVKAKDRALACALAEKEMRVHTLASHAMNALSVEVTDCCLIPEDK